MYLSTMSLIAKRDKDAIFESEFLPYADALYNYGYQLTFSEDDAKDLVQDTLMKSYRFMDSYTEGTNAKAWLFKILKNGFINEYRRKSRTPNRVDFDEIIKYRDDEGPVESEKVDTRQEVFQNLMGDEVTKAINELPLEFRMVIVLCDIEEFSYEEIAAIADIPVGTVRSRLHRARNMLKDKLRNYALKNGYKENR